MSSHYKGIGLALLLIVVMFTGALIAGQSLVAFSILFAGAVLLFIFSIAYMRPSGRSPEHHGKVDRLVNDTKP
jgi:predicted membrane channel-forming protein YqfA (hemolysin III family)